MISITVWEVGHFLMRMRLISECLPSQYVPRTHPLEEQKDSFWETIFDLLNCLCTQLFLQSTLHLPFEFTVSKVYRRRCSSPKISHAQMRPFASRFLQQTADTLSSPKTLQLIQQSNPSIRFSPAPARSGSLEFKLYTPSTPFASPLLRRPLVSLVRPLRPSLPPPYIPYPTWPAVTIKL
jgi:hypothetical protein